MLLLEELGTTTSLRHIVSIFFQTPLVYGGDDSLEEQNGMDRLLLFSVDVCGWNYDSRRSAEMGSPILVLSGLIFPHNISPKSEVEIEMDLEILDSRISRDKLPGLKIQKLEIQCV